MSVILRHLIGGVLFVALVVVGSVLLARRYGRCTKQAPVDGASLTPVVLTPPVVETKVVKEEFAVAPVIPQSGQVLIYPPNGYGAIQPQHVMLQTPIDAAGGIPLGYSGSINNGGYQIV